MSRSCLSSKFSRRFGVGFAYVQGLDYRIWPDCFPASRFWSLGAFGCAAFFVARAAWKACGHLFRCCFRMFGSEPRLPTDFSHPWWARFMILGRTKRVSCQWNRYMFFIGICFPAVPLPNAALGRVHHERGESQLPPETVLPPFAQGGLL